MLVVVSLLTLVLYALLIFYYEYHWKKTPELEPEGKSGTVFFSVVIAARNEEANLPDLLASLEKQTYNKSLFEVVVVDDHSEDSTASIAKEWKNRLNINLVSLDDNEEGSKKKAIEAGINKASGDWIITTDADCTAPDTWLSTFAETIEEKNPVFIAAPVKYKGAISLLFIFQTLDFLSLQGITAAGLRSGLHRMCNGANLAYKKSVFIEVGGFGGVDSFASGDDLLLMQKVYKQHKNGIAYLKSKSAIIETIPPASWEEFLGQRKRWGSKSKHYIEQKIKWVLGLVFLLNLMFFLLIIGAAADWVYEEVWLMFWLGKILIELPLMISVARFFNQQWLLFFFPLMQPFHMIYILTASVWSQVGPYTWKGRRKK